MQKQLDQLLKLQSPKQNVNATSKNQLDSAFSYHSVTNLNIKSQLLNSQLSYQQNNFQHPNEASQSSRIQDYNQQQQQQQPSVMKSLQFQETAKSLISPGAQTNRMNQFQPLIQKNNFVRESYNNSNRDLNNQLFGAGRGRDGSNSTNNSYLRNDNPNNSLNKNINPQSVRNHTASNNYGPKNNKRENRRQIAATYNISDKNRKFDRLMSAEPSSMQRYNNQQQMTIQEGKGYENKDKDTFLNQQMTLLPEIKSTNLTLNGETMSPTSVKFQEYPEIINDNNRNRSISNQRDIQTLFGMSNSTLALNPSSSKLAKTTSIQRQQTENNISIDDISPELAAQIVKNYILPMFDSDNKRYLRKKYTQNSTTSKGNNLKTKSQLGGGLISPKTVYGELKLSEKLSEQLNELKFRFDSLQEMLEEVTYQRDQGRRELKELNTKYIQRGETINSIKRQNIMQAQVLKESIMKCVLLISSGNSLTSFAQISEQYRKHYAELLRDQLILNDSIKYQLQEVQSTKALNEAKYEIIEEQLKFLYNSLQSLANAKNLEDKFQFKIDTLQLQYNSMMNEKQDTMDNLRRTSAERDEAREFLKEMTTSRTVILKQKEELSSQFKAQVAKLDEESKVIKLEFEKLNDEFQKLEKFNKQLLNERDKMKQRLLKLKNRKFKIDQDTKICKKCGKEYNEKENFNWSCRTHQSEFGGEMWWCCGKTEKEAQGCKFSKHESKEDEEDDMDPDDKLQDQLRQLKNVRCLCCKELGHRMEQCPRDPNIRTNAQAADDFERISRIKDFRRLFQDTMILTTHFLKKCVKIPKIKMRDLNSAESFEKSRILDQLDRMKSNPFKRGAMRFEDYNYNIYNPYILVDSHKGMQMQRKGGYNNMSKINSAGTMGGEYKLTEKNLEDSVNQQYEFDDIAFGQKKMDTQESQEDGEQDQLRLPKRDNFQQIHTVPTQQEEPRVDSQPGEGDPDESNLEEDEGEEDDDEEEYTIFFEKDEIKSTKIYQQLDAFEDIRNAKSDMMLAYAGSHPSEANKIRIQDFMPKESVKEPSHKRKPGSKSYKSSHTADLLEERNQQMQDVDQVLDHEIGNLDQVIGDDGQPINGRRGMESDQDEQQRQREENQKKLLSDIKQLMKEGSNNLHLNTDNIGGQNLMTGSQPTTQRNHNAFEDTQKLNLLQTNSNKSQGGGSKNKKNDSAQPSAKGGDSTKGLDAVKNEKELKDKKKSTTSANSKTDNQKNTSSLQLQQQHQQQQLVDDKGKSKDSNNDGKSNKESRKSKKSKTSK